MLKLVYSHTDELNGWSEPELQVVMGIQILLGGLIKMSIQPNMERLMEEVRDGKLDFALTKPEDSQLFVSVREVRIWRAVDIVAGALVLAYGISGLERGRRRRRRGAVRRDARGRRADDLLLLALHHDRRVLDREHLEHPRALRRRLPTGRWPVSIYPGWLRIGVTFLIPIAFAITVPAEAVTSRLEWGTVVLAVGFCAALFAFTRWWWGFGLRRYSGASA